MRRFPCCLVDVCGLVAIVCLACTGVANAQSRREAHDNAVREGCRLLEAGRYDQALSAYGEWGTELGEEFLRRADQARRQGQPDQAMELYKAYLHYYPFGWFSWRGQRGAWSRAADGYMSLLDKTEPAPSDKQAAQDQAARTLWERLSSLANGEALSNAAVQEEIFALADEIISKFPIGHFCPAAAHVAGFIAQHLPRDCGHTLDRGRSVRRLEACLEKMQDTGAPARSRVQVLLQLAESCSSSLQNEWLRRAMQAYEEIRRTTDVSYERRYALLESAQMALNPDDTSRSWKHEPILKLLVSLGDEAKAFVLTKIEGQGTDPPWAAVVLAKMKAPEALPAIKDRIAACRNCWWLKDYFYALSLLQTDEAYDLLREYAGHGSGIYSGAASRVLEEHPRQGE